MYLVCCQLARTKYVLACFFIFDRFTLPKVNIYSSPEQLAGRRSPVYCERNGDEKKLIVNLSSTEADCINAVITELINKKAKVLIEQGWIWKQEQGTVANVSQWEKLCDSAISGPPDWVCYARVFASILCVGELRIPLKSVRELLCLDSAFMAFSTYLNYYLPPAHKDYESIKADAAIMGYEIRKKLLTSWNVVK